MSNIMRNIVEHYGRLISVTACFELAFPEDSNRSRFDEIELQFEHGVVTIAAEPEDDSIRVISDRSKLNYRLDVTTVEPWTQVIGSPTLWTWTLTNHAGYVDGFQIEFRTSNEFRSIQLMCEASALSVRSITLL